MATTTSPPSFTASQIRRARKNFLGMTQRELSIELGVNELTISKWERGVVEPRLRYVREIAKMAKLPFAWFFESEVAA